jgi:hypothetical protein
LVKNGGQIIISVQEEIGGGKEIGNNRGIIVIRF